MSLSTWNFFKNRGRMLRHFKRRFWRYPVGPGLEVSAMEGWIPPVRIHETDTSYLIKAEIPGVDETEVQITICNGMLTIQGECKHINGEGNKPLHRGSSYDSFEHSFRMPKDADAAKVATEFINGMICVTLPKTGKANHGLLSQP